MKENTQQSAGVSNNYQPANVDRDIQTLLKKKLQSGGPVTINDSGNRYRVTGIDKGFFTCEALDRAGQTPVGGIQELPLNEHYLGLVISQIDWRVGSAAVAG